MMETAVSNCSIKMYETTQVIQLIIYVPIFFFDVLFNALALLVFHCKQRKRAMCVHDQLNHCTLVLILPFTVSFQRQEKIQETNTA